MTRDADRDPDLKVDPDRACARDWQPVDAPERRPEPKCEDEPVQWASEVATDTSDLDPAPDPEPGPQLQPELDADPNRERPRTDLAARAHDTCERDYSEHRDGGAVKPDGEGRHG